MIDRLLLFVLTHACVSTQVVWNDAIRGDGYEVVGELPGCTTLLRWSHWLLIRTVSELSIIVDGVRVFLVSEFRCVWCARDMILDVRGRQRVRELLTTSHTSHTTDRCWSTRR